MNRKRLTVLLGVEAAACLALDVSQWRTGMNLGLAFALPFAPLGQVLRRMSLSGAAGNIAATALYVLLCLIPAAFLLARFLRHRALPEDALLALMSAELFFQMYLMVNPGLMTRWLGQAAGGDMGGAVLGGVFYSTLTAYLIVRLLRACLAADGDKLRSIGSVILAALAAVLLFQAMTAAPIALVASIGTVRQANQGSEHLLGLTYVFLVLRYVIYAGTYLLDLWVVFGADRMLTAWAREPYSDEAVVASAILSRRSAYTLIATVLANLAFHLLQLVFMRRLHTAETLMDFPLFSLALVVAALLLAQYLREGKKLKDDNDLFI